MGAVSDRPHARARQHRTLGKPLSQIPSQHLSIMFKDSKALQGCSQKLEALGKVGSPENCNPRLGIALPGQDGRLGTLRLHSHQLYDPVG
jgi:hypothetical protein